MRILAFFAFSLTLVLSLTVHAKPNSQFRSYWQPVYHGKRLNYCNLQGKCGKPVADQYCRMMGYSRADQTIIANNVGLTNYIGSNARCRGWQCDSFKTIRCTSEVSHTPPKSYHYRTQQFVYPRFNHYRVDWCYDGKTGCGKRAAYSFCRRLGFMNVKQYHIQKSVPATQAIGNQKLCFGPKCNAFSKINCFR